MHYELLYIIPTPFTENDVPQIQEKIADLIKSVGGTIEENKNLGDRKLAYEIKHIKRGFYILNTFTLDPSQIKTLEQKLKLQPEILRFMICKAISRKEKTKTKKAGSKTIDETVNKLLEDLE